MKKVTLQFVFCLTVMVIFSIFAAAAENGAVATQNGRMTFITKPQSQAQTSVKIPSGLVAIYNNIGTAYPKGEYWCCEGATVSGPNNPTGVQWWNGVSFIPSANSTVKAIIVAIGYLSGTNQVLISLANDNNGLPGTTIQSWTVTSLPGAGTCCSLVINKDGAGIPVTAGTRYWITATTNSSDSDLWASWNVADTDQIDPVPSAALCMGSVCGQNNGKWVAVDQTPGLAAAVLGTSN